MCGAFARALYDPNVYAIYCVFTNRTRPPRCVLFGVTAMDFAIECQMDKLAISLAWTDGVPILTPIGTGDMKAHRREAKNTR